MTWRSHFTESQALLFASASLLACAETGSEPDLLSAASHEQALATNVIASIAASGYVDAYYPENPGTRKGEYLESGVHYPILEQVSSVANQRHIYPTFIPSSFPGSLYFAGFSDPDGSPDRVEIRLSPNDSDADVLNFDEWRFLRFDVKIHPSTENPPNRVLMHQTWQRDYLEGPAFQIGLRGCQSGDACAPGQMVIDFGYRTQLGQTNATIIANDAVSKNQWYRYYVQMKPRYQDFPTGRGVILVWRDVPAPPPGCPNGGFVLGCALNSSNYQFDWGYPPADGNNAEFDVRIGIYRAAAGGAALTTVGFWMDNVKLTRSAAAMPGS